MPYTAKDFTSLIGTPGLSKKLLETHFKLYEGYVKNTNTLYEKLAKLSKAEETTPDYAELKRRFGWEWNGMRLHEYYFGNLKKGGVKLDPSSPLAKKITREFGSKAQWERYFKLAGGMRGIGWVALYYDKTANRLFNVWIDEHNTGHLAGEALILIMDVFEHAFMIDYGTDRKGYMKAFFNALDWETATDRFDAARR